MIERDGKTMRLIDADALMTKMKRYPLYPLVEKYGVIGVIDTEPIVDAVQVVRCKDCRYWECNGLTSWCEAHERHGLPDNFYCTFGERRSE